MRTSSVAAIAAACILVAAAPASAQPRRDFHGYHGRYYPHHWHRPWGYAGGYYAPPPVVYAPPYYAPPPVVYGPGVGLNIHIR